MGGGGDLGMRIVEWLVILSGVQLSAVLLCLTFISLPSSPHFYTVNQCGRLKLEMQPLPTPTLWGASTGLAR